MRIQAFWVGEDHPTADAAHAPADFCLRQLFRLDGSL